MGGARALEPGGLAGAARADGDGQPARRRLRREELRHRGRAVPARAAGDRLRPAGRVRRRPGRPAHGPGLGRLRPRRAVPDHPAGRAPCGGSSWSPCWWRSSACSGCRPRTPPCPTWCRGTCWSRPTRSASRRRTARRSPRPSSSPCSPRWTGSLRRVMGWLDRGAVDVSLYVNGLSFIVSGIVIARLTGIPSGPAAHADEGSVWRVIGNGWAYVVRTPVVRALVLGMAGAFAAGGVVVGLARTYVADLGARRRRVRRAVRRGVRGHGRRPVAGAAAAVPAQPAAGLRGGAHRRRRPAAPARADPAPRGRRGPRRRGRLPRRRRLGHRHDAAGAGGARRAPRPHLRLRGDPGPPRARAGARSRAAAGRAHRRGALRSRGRRRASRCSSTAAPR